MSARFVGSYHCNRILAKRAEVTTQVGQRCIAKTAVDRSPDAFPLVDGRRIGNRVALHQAHRAKQQARVKLHPPGSPTMNSVLPPLTSRTSAGVPAKHELDMTPSKAKHASSSPLRISTSWEKAPIKLTELSASRTALVAIIRMSQQPSRLAKASNSYTASTDAQTGPG